MIEMIVADEYFTVIVPIMTVLNDPTASSQHHRSRSSYTTIPAFVEAATSAQIILDELFFVLRRRTGRITEIVM